MKGLHVGFSGSRYGMTEKQKEVVRHFLNNWRVIGIDRTFRHGCCAGADFEADQLAREYLYKVGAHPGPRSSFDCYDSAKKLGVTFWEENERKPYFERNVDIVMRCNVLITTPNAMSPNIKAKGGTWYTTRVGIDRGRSTYLVLANGETHKFFDRKYLGVIVPGNDILRTTP